MLHGYQAYVCVSRLEEPTLAKVERLHARRNELMVSMEREGIATRQGTHAAALQALYVNRYGATPADLPYTHIADRLSIALPLYPQLTEQEQDRVVALLAEAFGA